MSKTMYFLELRTREGKVTNIFLSTRQLARSSPIYYFVSSSEQAWEVRRVIVFIWQMKKDQKGWIACDLVVPELKPGSTWFWTSFQRTATHLTNNPAPLWPELKEIPNCLKLIFPGFFLSFALLFFFFLWTGAPESTPQHLLTPLVWWALHITGRMTMTHMSPKKRHSLSAQHLDSAVL